MKQIIAIKREGESRVEPQIPCMLPAGLYQNLLGTNVSTGLAYWKTQSKQGLLD